MKTIKNNCKKNFGLDSYFNFFKKYLKKISGLDAS